MIIDVKILNQVLDNQIEYIKRTIHHNKMRFIQGAQSWFNIQKAMNITHNVNRLKMKTHVVLSIMQKKHLTNPTLTHDKTLSVSQK